MEKIIEVYINRKLTKLKPKTVPEAQDKAKKLLKKEGDSADIYTVIKEHIITITKGSIINKI